MKKIRFSNRLLVKFSIQIIAVFVLLSQIIFPIHVSAAACVGKTDGLCQAPTKNSCPLSETCCESLDDCLIDDGNVRQKNDDTGFTPTKMRDEVSSIIQLNPTLDSPGAILSALLPYLFVFGGIVLLVMLIWGGFEVMGGATNPKSSENGKNRITSALKGFGLLFIAIWIAQLAQFILGINILSN